MRSKMFLLQAVWPVRIILFVHVLSSPLYAQLVKQNKAVTDPQRPVVADFRQEPAEPPLPYEPSMYLNAIRFWEAKYAEPNAENLKARSFNLVRQTARFFDGLGRELQTVVKQGAIADGVALDLVTANTHDRYGRQSLKYLPFSVSGGGNSGNFILNPFIRQQEFYRKQYPAQHFFYHQTVFDHSPIAQIQKELSPGDSWAGSDCGVAFKTEVNTGSDSVRRWSVNSSPGGFGKYFNKGIYAAGTLYKTVLTDEHNNQVVEFKNKQGLILLKKVQSHQVVGKGHTGWICTYFIYDDLGRLRCVLQPEGLNAVKNNNWQLNNTMTLAEQCFRYDYDRHGRMIRKQVPGGGECRMVYDARGRLVLSQDANMRSPALPRWKYFRYDEQNRPVASGLWINAHSQEEHALRAASSCSYPDLRGQTYEELNTIHYDDYNGLPAGLSSVMERKEEAFFNAPSGNAQGYVMPRTPSNRLKNLVTWSATKILGTPDQIITVNHYDEAGHILQVQVKNITGGISVHSFQYNFSRQVLRVVQRIGKAGKQSRIIPVYTQNTYDATGRLICIGKRYTPTGPMRVIAKMEYDESGRPKVKKLGTNPVTSEPLETLHWDYHIRGWLQGINRQYLSDTSSESNWFGYDLGYDGKGFRINGTLHQLGSRQLNSNIAGLQWKSTGDDQTRKYAFSYDAGNRLTNADFSSLTGVGFKSNPMDFSIGGMQYDQNGNILSMTQKGWTTGSNFMADSMLYGYHSGTNKLSSIRDATKDTSMQGEDFRAAKNPSAPHYRYDPCGNMIADQNKGISSIQYNHLQRPEKIILRNRATIHYTWAANGEKLKRTITDSTRKLILTTLYLDGAVFSSVNHFAPSEDDYEDSLQYLLHEEGRARFTGSGTHLDYFIRDHLSNVRMILTEQQQTDYYPAATMETSSAKTEETIYQNLPFSRVPRPAGYPVTANAAANQFVACLRANSKLPGPSMLLKVMAGDRFNLRVNNWYKAASLNTATTVNLLPALVQLLGAALPLGFEGKIPSGTHTSHLLETALSAFFSQRNQQSTADKPRAFLNYLLLDENFQPVITHDGRNSGFNAAGPANQLNTITVSNRIISRNGYLFIFLSNGSANTDHYFDDLQVTHIRGPLLEENHYYPFGLRMQGISSKAHGAPDNKLLHAGREMQGGILADSPDPQWYDFGERIYDVQTGRWMSVDGAAETYYGLSPYAYTGNNPVNAKEVDGNLFIFASGFMLNQWMGGSNATMQVQQREWIDKGAYLVTAATEINPNQYAPDRDFFRALPRNNGDPFPYWEQVDQAYRTVFNDNNAWYINGSFTPGSQATDRFGAGSDAGRLLIEKLDAGVIPITDGETIKIVGHSQGAAYAAGIATELAKHEKYGSRIEFVDYIAPHQPGDFEHPSSVPGRQFSTVNDKVSSGFGVVGSFLNMVNGGSYLDAIRGVQDGVLRYYGNGGKGGHYVGTWIEDLIRYWKSHGIPVTQQ